jgi:hypothetical protein
MGGQGDFRLVGSRLKLVWALGAGGVLVEELGRRAR